MSQIEPANPLRRKRWNPYVVGALIGVLSWITFLTMDRALGTSSSLVHVAGLIETATGNADKVTGPAANSYFQKEINEKTPMFDWQVFLVIGVFIGAILSSRLSGDKSTECVPGLWSWRFGPSRSKRYAAAFLGGAVMLFGARMAGGCTSGHGITGSAELDPTSFVAMGTFMAVAIGVAHVLRGALGI